MNDKLSEIDTTTVDSTSKKKRKQNLSLSDSATFHLPATYEYMVSRTGLN